MMKTQKNNQIANLNYLMVVLYNYLEEMDYLNTGIEKNCYPCLIVMIITKSSINFLQITRKM